jgi:penicillin-binding protein 1C
MTIPEPEDPNERLRRLLDSEEETRADLPAAEDGSEPPKRSTPVPDPDASGATPPFRRPALDKDNMPLPRRVDQIDVDGTRVTPAAYDRPTAGRQLRTRVTLRPPAPPPPKPPFDLRQALNNINWRSGMGCFLRLLILAAFVTVVLGLCLGSVALYEYYSIARTLPSVQDLRNRASQFETTRILDRNGSLLYEILDPNAGRRTYVPLSKISPNLVAATIATEDQDFYSHPGFDFWAIVRALWMNYTTGGEGGGASTITQQLARALLLTPEERSQRTYTRKAREIILAAEITRRYTKDEILELYLNEIYYGNLAYGVEAAAETYFGKTAEQMTLGEASFLAGLPQSPSIYDIYTNPEITLLRQQQVLVLMYDLSREQNCIHVSNSPETVCVDPMSASNAANEMKVYNFHPPEINTRYPHWVNYVRSLLEEQYDAQTIYRSGFTVYTSLDPHMQDEAERLVTEQLAALAVNNAHNGALVAIRPSTGEILAMVGSPDFNNDAIAGQINMAVSPTRQPGSSIKPVNYVAAFEKGWTPATLIWDVPSEFPPSGDPNDLREPYRPVNYDGKNHGPVTVRVALANSFNIPAVKTLNFVGVYGPGGMVEMSKRLGMTTFTRDDYGLALTLGGGDVSLLELTGAYGVFANNGQRVPPVAILKITDFQGNVVYVYEPKPGEQVIRAEHAYLMSSILSDNESRSWMFGSNSLLNLPFQVAAKTGTTNDFRDNWTLGYTPDLVTGVWVGNADYTPMINTTGLTGAAPIWSQFMQFAVPYLTNGIPTQFARPPGIVDTVICAVSGTLPSDSCRQQKTEIFASDQPPLPANQDLIRRARIDVWTGFEASDACKDFVEEEKVLNVTDPWARDWLRGDEGRAWMEQHDLPRRPRFAPERECRGDDPRPMISFDLPDDPKIHTNVFEIRGTADATGLFESWRLEYGLGGEPGQWILLNQSNNPVRNGTLHMWDVSGIPNGVVSLRLTVIGKNGEVERIRRINIDLPLPATVTPSVTPIPVIIPTWTPVPSETPAPTDTSAPPPTEPPTEPPTAQP